MTHRLQAHASGARRGSGHSCSPQQRVAAVVTTAAGPHAGVTAADRQRHDGVACSSCAWVPSQPSIHGRAAAELCNGHVNVCFSFRASQVHKTLHNHQDQQRRGMPNNTTRLPFVQIARKTPSIRASGQPEPARWGSLGHNRLRLLCSRAAEVAAIVIAIGATACVAYGGTLPSSRSVWLT